MPVARLQAPRRWSWLLVLALWPLPLPAVDWLPRDAGSSVRVLSWNVTREQFFAMPAEHDALLQAVQPDLLLLDEMPEHAEPAQVLEEIRRALPGRDWQLLLGDLGGNFERSSILSRWPLQRLPRFDHLRYSRRDIRRWNAAALRAGWDAAKIARRWQLGVAAVAAVAEIDGRRVLLVAVDLQCCGDAPDAWEELRRQREAELLRAAIDTSLREQRIDAVLLAGDLNLVQGDRALHRLLGKTSAMPLQAATIRRQGDASDWTWDGRGTPYPSRRIDYQLFGGDLRPVAGRLFDSEELSPPDLQQLRLLRDSSQRLSQHRPLVADYRWVD